MIFVTVGTHEQQFNRLVEYMDMYQADHPEEPVVIQYGYSDYKCKNAHAVEFLSPTQMNENLSKADIIITHGGPSSFLAGIEAGKRVIVVPRMEKFREHVNNHQVEFLKNIAPMFKDSIFPVFNISNLATTIKILQQKEEKSVNVKWHNQEFNNSLGKVVSEMMGDVH